jgi:hypothetical protein
MDDKILVDGFFSYDIPETAPDWVLGKSAYNVSKFAKFLDDHKQYAINGFLTVQTLRSKSGKRYAVLDLYEYNKKKADGDQSSGYDKFKSSLNKPSGNVEEELPVIQQEELPEDFSKDIPF